MADTTGKQTPDTDPKVSDKTSMRSGPVKPPVLEGSAKPAASPKPDEPTKPPSSASKTDKPATSASTPKSGAEPTAPSSSGAWLAGLTGGVLGLGAAYGLAWFGLWPTPDQVSPPADPRIAQFAAAIPELETVTGTVQDELSTLTGRVATLETTAGEPSAAPIDTSALASTQDLAALAARVEALSSANPDASAAAQSLAAIEAELASLRASVSETAAQVTAAQGDIAALIESTDQDAGSGLAAARLPLILSSLESAFDTGRPFDTELSAL